MSQTTHPELWRRAEVIFDAALATPEDQRSTAVERLCGNDLELRGRVDDLLAAASKTEQPETPSQPLDGSSAPPELETQVGPYRLLQPLGSGGMSHVVEAERVDGEVHQRVAVKLLKEPLNEAKYGHLLRRERQILARLEHPNIARFLDAGTTRGGSPYVVMELVRGLSITEHCDTQRLGVEARIRLFLDVCSAVELAHRNLIVHRDLKPANILVADSGEPKLLDFGIARFLQSDDEATRTRERFHTPSYASPEQLAGRSVTTATDIYSLGVVLYRLLTQVVPQPPKGEAGEELRRPSAACNLVGDSTAERLVLPPEARAAGLASTPKILAKRLRGDLDAICSQCLAFEPEARYVSVTELRRDLERHLAGLPILARPQSWLLRTQKLFRRNRAATFASILAVSSFLVFTLSTAIQLGRVQAERDDAKLAEAEAEEVTRFLQESFSLADPHQQALIGDRNKADLTMTKRNLFSRKPSSWPESKMTKHPRH